MRRWDDALVLFTELGEYSHQHLINLKCGRCIVDLDIPLTTLAKLHGSSTASWWSCTATWRHYIRTFWNTLPWIPRRPLWRSCSLTSATSVPCLQWVYFTAPLIIVNVLFHGWKTSDQWIQICLSFWTMVLTKAYGPKFVSCNITRVCNLCNQVVSATFPIKNCPKLERKHSCGIK